MRVEPQLDVQRKLRLARQLEQEKTKLATLQNKLQTAPGRRKPSIAAKIKETEQRIVTLRKQIAAIR